MSSVFPIRCQPPHRHIVIPRVSRHTEAHALLVTLPVTMTRSPGCAMFTAKAATLNVAATMTQALRASGQRALAQDVLAGGLPQNAA